MSTVIKKHQKDPLIFVFDVDDTLLETTALTKSKLFYKMDSWYPHAETVQFLSENDAWASKTLLKAIRIADKVLIVSNGSMSWLWTAFSHMPKTSKVIRNHSIHVSSALDAWEDAVAERDDDGDVDEYKTHTFRRIIPESATVVSVGDKEWDGRCVHDALGDNGSVVYVPFIEDPKPGQVTSMLQKYYTKWDKIASHALRNKDTKWNAYSL